nr:MULTISPECIES: hypothetical protein [unclassified Streptomyces]
MVNIEPGPGEGPGDDELALRRLFQDAVAGIEPSQGSLEHLRRAVPARRTRKRQALVGAAAAAVLLGTAVPAFVHVASSGGVTAAADPVNAGHGQEAQGGTGTETGIVGGGSTPPPRNGTPQQGTAEGAAGDPQRPGGTGASADPRPSHGTGQGATPPCGSGQLGVRAAVSGGIDGQGRVYGTFRIANVSGSPCVVSGSGSVGFEARGAADPGRISVVRHTPGDGSGLPDGGAASLVLKPNGSYEVKFVWVPEATCPTGGGSSPSPTPVEPTEEATTPPPTDPPTTANPDPTTGGGSGGGTGGSGGSGTSGNGGGTGPGTGAGSAAGTGAEAAGTAPQLFLSDGPAEGSVLITHTPAAGGPTATTTIPDACAGTIYRTGVLGG